MAHPVRAGNECGRLRQQYQGAGQPAQFRNGQVFWQRGLRGAPLRYRTGKVGTGPTPQPAIPVRTQRRAGADYRAGANGHDRACRLAGTGRRNQPGRLHPDQPVYVAVVPAPGVPRLRLPGDQGLDGQYRENVRTDGAGSASSRHDGRQGTGNVRRPYRFRSGRLWLHTGTSHPQGGQLCGGTQGESRGSGYQRRRQIDAGQTTFQVLRPRCRPHSDRRPGYSTAEPGLPAPGHRHCSAGYRAVQRQHFRECALR